jgi:RNA polymerase sigma factor (sigma-70 family)
MRTDAQLIADARSDPDAFGELYRRHAEAIHRWFRVRTDERTAEDLTAETFAQAVLALKRFRDEAAGSAAPWLFGIARNLLRRYRESRRVEIAARRRLGMPIQSEELEEPRTTDGAVARALARLPIGQRKALELRVIDEQPYARVAAELGCSETAARIRVMRALDSLTRLLKGVTP